MTNPRPNPYHGPRSFQTGEKLYGRDRETAELLDLCRNIPGIELPGRGGSS